MASPDNSSRHRLLAILAADVAGYSRLMTVDDTATVAALEQARSVFRRCIGASDGRVVDMPVIRSSRFVKRRAARSPPRLPRSVNWSAGRLGWPRTVACGFASASTWVT